MFCPDCGTQCDSKFCPNCGKDLQPNMENSVQKKIPPLNKPYYYEANGKRVDLNKVVRCYGNGWRKKSAYWYVMDALGVSKDEAKAIIEPVQAAHAGEKISFWRRLGATFALAGDEGWQKGIQQMDKKKQLEESGVVFCPKCLSTSVTAAKRGFSAGQAFVGGPLFGAVGANKIQCVCLKCGHEWKP